MSIVKLRDKQEQVELYSHIAEKIEDEATRKVVEEMLIGLVAVIDYMVENAYDKPE